ncbi:MAG: tRNA (adenosine(37)-N6)-threonylcarbamoyltransferase complex transferase subunit TsaD [Bacilli bacterium]|nr:tRNA (adenosine(37)-N6)-threonylcarbamoyltransferase complex transferase subunit TsaD [Bacilli bacterium]
MKDTYILAIESSCDETSMSIVKNGHVEISTVTLSQMDIHKQYGGVVPEIASRNHIENITMVLDECLESAKMTMDDIDYIGVTYGPGLVGSLLVGIQCAKTLAFLYNKPLIPVHHIAGHIYANRLVGEFKFPLMALVVSGGHTDLIIMKEDYRFEYIGGTLDDAIGEAYDKVARVMDLPYPGGPRIDKLAKIGKHTYNLPTPKNDNSYDFSFSGIKSAVINLAHNEKQRGNELNKEDLACSFQETVVNILSKKTMKAIKEYNLKQLIVAGGVAANSGLRESLTKLCEEQNIELLIPPINYCTDNATMIGCAAYYAQKDGKIADLKLNAKAVEKLN